MFDTLTTDLGSRFLIAAGGVAIGLVLLVVILMVLRKRNAPLFVRGGKSREPRLAVLDAAAVDTRRRLVLIRRDDIEHLIMIGGPTDIVIESGIGLAVPQTQILQATTPVLNAAEKASIREPEVATPVITQTRTQPFITANPAPVRVDEPARAETVPAVPVRVADRVEPAIIPPAANAIQAAASVQPVAARPAPAVQANPVVESQQQPQVQPLQPVSSAAQALYRDTTADEEEKVLADMLTRAQENRAAANAHAAVPPAVAPQVTPRPAMQPQANPVQPAGLAHGQINRRIEPDLGKKDDSAEDILEAARNRVLASRPADPAPEQRQQAGGRIEPGFANPVMSAARPAEPAAMRPVAPPVAPPVEQAILPSREDLASEFEKILEAEMAANGIQLDAPVVAAPVVQNQPVIPNPVRPANLPPVTGASPDNALEREMQRLLAERGLDRSGRA